MLKNLNILALTVLTQFFEGLLHVHLSVNVTGVRRQQREVLTLGRVAVHLHVHAHCCQRLQGLENRCDGGAVQQTNLYSKQEERKTELSLRERTEEDGKYAIFSW